MSGKSAARHVLVILAMFGGQAWLHASPQELVVIERRMLAESFRLFSLEVDRAGMLYWGSPKAIVKLRPDGERVFELRPGEQRLLRFIDFRIAPSGELVVIGGASDTPGRLVTRGLIFDAEGRLRRSFDVPEFIAQAVEPAEGGEVFLVGVRVSGQAEAFESRMWIYRIGADGQVLDMIPRDESEGVRRVIWRAQRLIVRGQDLFWLDPETLRLRRFSLEAGKWDEQDLGLGELKAQMERSGSGRRMVEVDHFASINGSFLLAVVAQESRLQKRELKGGSWVLHRPFTYRLYLLSPDGARVRPIPVGDDWGSLQAVGRDGFLYFVRHITTGRETKTEVLKAAVR
ncbi:hypothetical protein HRbin10_01032 [bacterium HR10]|uniref:Uncharacterized protein n=1 Tax=uncultured Acidobacteriota bacterium TaxID=171953 RepID=H5SH81_9BACT|nr:hypothetical protein HGMM_F28D03C24 [uncultured Acidobacteriota bacterium]GBC81917.1 hypothetical protein HRbin10_01032 [bacterium HR10]